MCEIIREDAVILVSMLVFLRSSEDFGDSPVLNMVILLLEDHADILGK